MEFGGLNLTDVRIYGSRKFLTVKLFKCHEPKLAYC